MAKVQGYTEDDVDLLIAHFEGIVTNAITHTLEAVANNLEGAIVADASSAGLSTTDIAIVTQKWQEQVDDELLPYIAEVYTGSATSVAIGLGEAFPDDALPGIPLVADEYTVTYMKTVKNRLVGVSDELWEDIRNELLDGIAQGQSIPQIRARIVAVAGFSEHRAAAIARTEVHGAAESGSLAQMRFIGYASDEVTKQWIDVGDVRTRHTHRLADKQIVAMDEKFIVGGWPLDHPGDATGPANEVINCRCTQIFEVDEKPKMRCGNTIVAAATTATACIVPIKPVDISSLTDATIQQLFNLFMAHKITPAYGGSKIHKVLQDVRDALKAGTPADQMLEQLVDDRQILAAVDKYYAAKKDTFTTKYVSWAESAPGKKALGTAPAKKAVKAVKTTITPTPPPVPTPSFTPLPSVVPKPSPGDIVYTGKTLGSHGAQVWRNPTTSERWLFKPQEKFLTDLDIAMGKLQSKALVTRPGVYEIKLDGQTGSIQYMFESDEAFPNGSFNPLTLSADDIAVLQREQVFDWMISNFDTHSGQYIRLTDGTLYGTDKGQAFKFFGKDKLDWDYVPVTPLGQDRLTYPAMWQAFVQGKKIDLNDPTTGQLGEYIDRLMGIDDKTYRDILRPYAQKWYSDKALDDFLDRAVLRKNSLKVDFAKFYQRALAERAKHVPVPPTPVITPSVIPAVTTPVAAGSVSGDISGISYTLRAAIHDAWVIAGGGKKVTPGWGGSKIYKQLYVMRASDLSGELKQFTDLQLLRVLDQQGGFIGKLKTYEGEVKSWLATPAGKKFVGTKLDPSLSPAIVTAAPPTTPVLPVSAVIPDEAKEVLATGFDTHPHGIFAALPKFKTGDVIAYGRKHNGTVTYRVEKLSDTMISVSTQADGMTTWTTMMSGNSPASLALKFPGAQWKLKPIKTAGLSKIPGKLPNDPVTFDEIWASRFLWDDGDVVATGADGGDMWQVRSDGNGAFNAFFQSHDGSWTKSPGSVTDTAHKILDGLDLKLGASTLTSKTPSPLVTKMTGEKLTAGEIWTGAPTVPADVPFAYGYRADLNYSYRVVRDAKSTIVLQYQIPGNPLWSDVMSANKEHELELFMSKTTFYAAKANGMMPDEVLSLIPGAKSATKSTSLTLGVVKSKIVNKNVGEVATKNEIFYGAKNSSPGDIIAVHKAGIYHVVYQADGYHLEYRPGGVGDWSDAGILNSPSDIPLGADEWFAADGSTLPVAAKAAKTAKAAIPTPAKAKINTIAGKTFAMPISDIEIIDNWENFQEGRIIATGVSTKWDGTTTNYRVFVADGKLVSQKQTKAGAWTGTDVVVEKYHLPYGAKWTYNGGVDQVTPVHLKAAKKAVAKKATPVKSSYAAPSVSLPKPSVATPVSSPVMLRDVDITMFTGTEHAHVVSTFKSSGGGIHSSSSAQDVWSSLQTAKATLQAQGGKYADITDLQILRIFDAANAKKHGVTDTHPIEQKIVKWLKSSAGKAWVGRRIDAPLATHEIPAAVTAFTDSTVPVDKQVYRIISTSEADKFGAESLAKYGDYKTGQKAALKEYTGGIYSAWNSAIRSGDISYYRNSILAAQAGMRPSTHAMLLHRGTSFAELNDRSITSYETLLPYIGRTYTNRGFNSTSVGGAAAFGGELLIEYEAPIGTPMAWVMPFSRHKSEREMLLPAHLVYEIVRVTKKGHTTVMRVRIVGAAG